MATKFYSALLSCLLIPMVLSAKVGTHPMGAEALSTSAPRTLKDVKTQCDASGVTQIDIIDVLNKWFRGRPPRAGVGDPFKSHLSVVPAVGYTTATSFTFAIYANNAFYTSTDANLSTINASIAWSANSQILAPLRTNIWMPNNKWFFTTDWRYMSWPSFTYGLGGYTKLSNKYLIDYSAVRFFQTAFKRVATDFYIGLGYHVEYYWNIKETDPPPGQVTDFQKYGLTETEFQSAPTINLLFDSRRNAINPQDGEYARITYIPNLEIFGNETDWHSVIVDLRKYIPVGNNNVLAFWNYDWITPSGTPPFLMLPSTGGDPYFNTGRGYITNRYRGRNMLYLEAEYRFGISRNGLFGGVVFANAQSFTEEKSRKFETVAPAVGAGLRLKLNKFSRTNVALDYGIGIGGSSSVSVNVGEVF